jgi:hypothetical protein
MLMHMACAGVIGTVSINKDRRTIEERKEE